MASASKTREALERVSRVFEKTPDLTAREVRVRANLARQTCDEALELLRRCGFLLRQRRLTEDTWSSALPYRAETFAPQAGFGDTYSTAQGGDG